MVYGVMSEKAVHYPYKLVSFRNLKNINEKQLKEDLNSVPWHIADMFDTIDKKYDCWNTQLNSILDEHAPIKKMKVREKDYMTTNWKKAIRTKRRFSKRYNKNRTQGNFELMKKWRNQATKERRKAIKEYWKQVSEKMKSNARNVYKMFRPFLAQIKI